MARQARRLAVSGIYHVMVRGIGRQALFHSAADNLAFLSAVTFCLAAHSGPVNQLLPDV